MPRMIHGAPSRSSVLPRMAIRLFASFNVVSVVTSAGGADGGGGNGGHVPSGCFGRWVSTHALTLVTRVAAAASASSLASASASATEIAGRGGHTSGARHDT